MSRVDFLEVFRKARAAKGEAVTVTVFDEQVRSMIKSAAHREAGYGGHAFATEVVSLGTGDFVVEVRAK